MPKKSKVPISATDPPAPGDTILRVELNYLYFPLFVLDVHHVGSKETRVHSIITLPSKPTIRTLTVIPDKTLGSGGPFEHRAFRAVEKLLSESYFRGGLEPQLVLRPSDILKAMGYGKARGPEYKALRTFFQRMLGMQLLSDQAICDKKRGVYLTLDEQVPPIYEDVRWAGSRMTIVLGSLYLSNLAANYVKLFDYPYYKKIRTGTARRLFELISPRAYKYGKEVYFTYSHLCESLPIARANYPSEVDRQFRPACKRLVKQRFIKECNYNVEIRGRYSTNPRLDGKFTFVMGDSFEDSQVGEWDKEEADRVRTIDPNKS